MNGDARLNAGEIALVQELLASRARFIVVGGYAAAAYYQRGLREDLDLIIDHNDSHTRGTVAAAIRYHCRISQLGTA
jgi:hypothetical protein